MRFIRLAHVRSTLSSGYSSRVPPPGARFFSAPTLGGTRCRDDATAVLFTAFVHRGTRESVKFRVSGCQQYPRDEGHRWRRTNADAWIGEQTWTKSLIATKTTWRLDRTTSFASTTRCSQPEVLPPAAVTVCKLEGVRCLRSTLPVAWGGWTRAKARSAAAEDEKRTGAAPEGRLGALARLSKSPARVPVPFTP